jgi:trimeric autotransporter adhesin
MNTLIFQFKKLTSPCLIAFALCCVAFSPNAQAAPSPDTPMPNPPAPGVLNTRDGRSCMPFVTTGVANSAFGAYSMFSLTIGNFNTAVGVAALDLNNADSNTAVGTAALLLNTDGASNTAVGVSALLNNTGSGNIALGTNAGVNLTTGDNNIDIGNEGDASDSDTIRMGNATHGRIFIPAINNIVLGAGLAVTIDSTTSLLGIATSSREFKQNIKPMDKSSEAILALKPVTFRYKQKLDPKAIPQFGLIAEEVERVNPDLVVRDKKGKPYAVRYEAVNAMLLNEFLKEHRKVKDLKANAARQQKQIDALTAGLQKVSAQLELNKPAQQTVLNNR